MKPASAAAEPINVVKIGTFHVAINRNFSLCFDKRKKRRGGWETIYIISNMELSAKEHVDAYNRRWVIDKSFRSMKQKFGLKDCQMLKGIRQTLHIFRVFLAYSFATLEKISKQKNSVEDVLNQFRRF